LRTGDLGRFTSKKAFLQIAGRKADVIQLSTGEKLNPAFIETQLLDSPYVGRCIVIGEGKPYAVALIVPYYINLRIYAQTHDLSFDSKEETLYHPEIKELFRKEVLDINTKLSTREHIGKFHLLQHEWTIKTGELSPVLKKKRGAILEKYSDVIRDLYGAGRL
jgi:long-chain acyl-CoA synthetase